MSRPAALFHRARLVLVISIVFVFAAIAGAALANWKEVDKMVSEQKYNEALKVSEEILKQARAAKDDRRVTEALVKITQLQMGLHGYETAVKFLREQEWPKASLDRALLNLYYAHSLMQYQSSYSWEIGQREKTVSTQKVDLRAWTRTQIGEEIRRSFEATLASGAELDAPPPELFSPYLSRNNYPDGVRPNLRDVIVYLAVTHLADSGYWTPEESNEVYKLPVKSLVATTSQRIALTDGKAHPLVRASALLSSHAMNHEKAGRASAALEARYQNLRVLHQAMQQQADRAVLRATLRDLQKRMVGDGWWAAGQALLAEFIEAENRPGQLIEAREAAMLGAKADRNGIGGDLCRAIISRIEMSAYQFGSMSSDGAERASILIQYKNLAKLRFRAYPLNIGARLKTMRGNQLFPEYDELKTMVVSTKPIAEWTVDLPPTRDYSMHRTFVRPPLKQPGAYMIVAGPPEALASAGQTPGSGEVKAVGFIVTDLVMETAASASSGAEARIRRGSDGRVLKGVEVSLYRYTWSEPPKFVSSAKTDDNGFVRLGESVSRTQQRGEMHFLVARQGENWAFNGSNVWFGKESADPALKGALIYTDRSVYRPGQTVQWKAIAYTGSRPKAQFHVAPGTSIILTLLDLNQQTVGTVTVKTNAFGTAAGEFKIPAGRPLGAWRISASVEGVAGQSDYFGWANIRVEEYKRPTFEAEIKEATGALRLNRKVSFMGSARYYFGSPVSSGRVSWRVSRQPVFPWWWNYWGWRPRNAAVPQVVATGLSPLNADGTFEISFLPQADEREAKTQPGLSYSFQIEADVTDDGGETRQASRAIRLGFVSIEAQISWLKRYFNENAPIEILVSLSRLDGTPYRGSGSYRLVRIERPKQVPVPSEMPRDSGGDEDESAAANFKTPGDSQRARWETSWSWERLAATWKAGAEIEKGTLTHGPDGQAKVNVEKGLKAGLYRLVYESKDEFGAPVQVSRDFVVASNRSGEVPLPLFVATDSDRVNVGERAKILIDSGFPGQEIHVDIYRSGRLVSRSTRIAGKDPSVFEIPVKDEDRGGFSVAVRTLRDYQPLSHELSIIVPYSDRQLNVEFSTFRDRLRPGGKETFRVKVTGPDKKAVQAGAAELLTYMYDKSLDIFEPHSPPSPLSLFPTRFGVINAHFTVGQSYASGLFGSFPNFLHGPSLVGDQLNFYSSYGIGGLGRGGFGSAGIMPPPAAMPRGMSVEADGVASRAEMVAQEAAPGAQSVRARKSGNALESAEAGALASRAAPGEAKAASAEVPLRENFSETAFFLPHLVTKADGSVEFEFTAPDSVTAWNVWVHAITKDLKSGSISRETRTVKELMVRPYLPRFLREGDDAEIRVTVNNAGDSEQSGEVTLEIEDPETKQSLAKDFGLNGAVKAPFRAPKDGSATVAFKIRAPKNVATYAFKTVARSRTFSDGERRALPVLPSRMHLVQSRFVTLRENQKKTLEFKEMAQTDDASRIDEKLVVNVDAQLFYGVLQALPYLVTYPYECTEQTLNRFLSTGIISSVFDKYPSVAKMAKEFSTRKTRLESFDEPDANRRMALEESPFLLAAKGGSSVSDSELVNVLDSRIAKAERERALAKLRKMQLPEGAFPWFQGGPPDPFMTLYILHGFAKANEFKVEVPKEMVISAWRYMKRYFEGEVRRMINDDCCWEQITLLNYVLSSYPDLSWTGGAFSDSDRSEMLKFSFRHWKAHSPYLKAYLTLTLHRAGRAKDAKLVWDSVMDSAKTDEERGTYWAPEDRAWLWYNDVIETHAFALRTLMELDPKDKRNDGLVQWLFLNKKLNHWKSTRATAETIYSLIHYLDKNAVLGTNESVTVDVGGRQTKLVFKADEYTGKKNQIVFEGEKIEPKTMSKVAVSKQGPRFAFASAAWHFSTDRLPKEDSGDFFAVSRRYFKRVNTGKEWTLLPLAEGARIEVGDQIEVQISLRTKHEAEYVHLRDPRAAGLEPENATSGYRWDLGIFWYEETRDSGANFFFSRLPVGEYTFKYRLRANMAGGFRIGPAEVQSMYAPEFNAYSAGNTMTIVPAAGGK